MTPILLGLGTGIFVGSVLFMFKVDNDLTMSDYWGLVSFLGMFAGLILFIVVGTLALGVHYDKQNCIKFGANTNRTTKFVRYNYWSWDCLSPTHDGHLIPIDQLRDVSQ